MKPLNRIRRILAISLAISLVGAVAVGCGSLSVREEKALGEQAQRAVRQTTTLVRDPVVLRYVRDLGKELVSAAEQSPFDFEFYVIEDDSLNAFAVPGGSIYLHTGMITRCEDVSELAGVMAHEIGHVTGRHIADNYRRRQNVGTAAQLIGLVIGYLTGSGLAQDAGGYAAQMASLAYLNSFTRDAERDADARAVTTLVRAGYDPEGVIRVFRTLQAEYGGGGPGFLSDHPTNDERISNAQKAISQLDDLGPARASDGGKLEIIQERIELIEGTDMDLYMNDEDEVDEDEYYDPTEGLDE